MSSSRSALLSLDVLGSESPQRQPRGDGHGADGLGGGRGLDRGSQVAVADELLVDGGRPTGPVSPGPPTHQLVALSTYQGYD
jgi:hypothetical protein